MCHQEPPARQKLAQLNQTWRPQRLTVRNIPRPADFPAQRARRAGVSGRRG
jgi:hypothetical protein